jgi:hypothetical protein
LYPAAKAASALAGLPRLLPFFWSADFLSPELNGKLLADWEVPTWSLIGRAAGKMPICRHGRVI